MPYWLIQILFVLLALIAEFLGTVGGFGSSVLFVPIAQNLESVQTVLALTGLLHVFGNTSRVWMFRKDIDWRVTLWFAVPSIVFTVLGAWLTDRVNVHWIELATGVFLVLLSVFYFSFPKAKLKGSNSTAVTVGSVSGFLTGLIGTGGAVRAAGLAGFELSKATFVATSAAIDFGNDAGRSIVYIAKGYLQPQHYIYIPFLLGAAFLGSWLGKITLDKISQEAFRKIVLVLILLIGLYTVLKGTGVIRWVLSL